jgi:hypothetical protein
MDPHSTDELSAWRHRQLAEGRGGLEARAGRRARAVARRRQRLARAAASRSPDGGDVA